MKFLIPSDDVKMFMSFIRRGSVENILVSKSKNIVEVKYYVEIAHKKYFLAFDKFKNRIVFQDKHGMTIYVSQEYVTFSKSLAIELTNMRHKHENNR